MTDESGRPVQGATVRLEYENYSVEGAGHEEDRSTNAKGYAHFPSHRGSASTLAHCYYTALSATAIAHASFGVHDWVFAFGKGLEGDAVSNGVVTDWTGSPDRMESHIVMKPLTQ